MGRTRVFTIGVLLVFIVFLGVFSFTVERFDESFEKTDSEEKEKKLVIDYDIESFRSFGGGYFLNSSRWKSANPVPLEEQEPNNSFQVATGPLGLGIEMSGHLSAEDLEDNFFFVVPSKRSIEVEFHADMKNQVGWVLYKGKSSSGVVAWGEVVENYLKVRFDVSAGTYFINVFTWNRGGVYRFKVR